MAIRTELFRLSNYSMIYRTGWRTAPQGRNDLSIELKANLSNIRMVIIPRIKGMKEGPDKNTV